jgi:hypothetical protein
MNTEDAIIKINEKMDTVLKVLQDFGLNVITQIGGLKHNINILTSQVDKLNDSMLNLKSISVKLENLGKMKESFNSELQQIQTLIKQSNLIGKLENISKETDEKSTRSVLSLLRTKIDSIEDIQDLIFNLESVKEELFSITGGHKVLFEISNHIKSLKEETLSDSNRTELKKKITFWINKIEN